MFVDVLLELKNKQTDQTYTYKVPTSLLKKIEIGKRVKVPFQHRELEGFILNVKKKVEGDFTIREILAVLDEESILNEELIKLGQFLKNTYLCSLSTAYATMLPKALKASLKSKKINKKYEKFLILNMPYDDALNQAKTKSQKEIIDCIEASSKLTKKEAQQISLSSVSTLLKKNIIREEQEEVYRLEDKVYVSDEKKILNTEQKNAYDAILKKLNTFHKFLLYGITGSGKTEVYMQVIEEVIKQGKTALVVVPEISLTPQFVYTFRQRFSNSVAVLHSHLSNGERYDEWRKIKRGEVKIVIGVRSAAFAPLSHLGIIIVDEEHAESYKQENTPRYNAIDVLEYRAELNQIPIVLGSATPTLERMAKSTKNLYTRLELKNRINHQALPICTIVDMKEEAKKGNLILSDALKNEIEGALSRQEQVILLLNRRGFSTTITCSNCGFTYKCPHCDITLTYHKTKNNLRCHYCGYTTYKKDFCPNCKESLNFYGYGTEKLEQLILKEFPDTKVLRMDADTTRVKNSYETMIEKFKNQEYDILLGTQMISKGLDFPKVSVVGIINADASLNIADFRSNERTFSLLSQAAGRAGRKDTVGTVVIQTYMPNNFILKCVKEQNYEKFYQYEMNLRKKLKYPPFYYLVGIKVTGMDYDLCSKEAVKVVQYLKKNVDENTIILGPTTANVFKVNNIYRFQILIKYRFDTKLMQTLKELDSLFILNHKIHLEIDINPTSV